jgi:hypothetical protein
LPRHLYRPSTNFLQADAGEIVRPQALWPRLGYTFSLANYGQGRQILFISLGFAEQI